MSTERTASFRFATNPSFGASDGTRLFGLVSGRLTSVHRVGQRVTLQTAHEQRPTLPNTPPWHIFELVPHGLPGLTLDYATCTNFCHHLGVFFWGHPGRTIRRLGQGATWKELQTLVDEARRALEPCVKDQPKSLVCGCFFFLFKAFGGRAHEQGLNHFTKIIKFFDWAR